ncbi:predicted protein [Nematostella vectensis]|uniref:SH3 domain-containing protein n=1 Tax=Nematostella vectensis TaxID=45351 RepID=A7SIY9_NEMVE|nr:predicted protein [Nematostella vectensis]|eukprot:XP_001628367.1 predicted protein [Nematostella vectensis]
MSYSDIDESTTPPVRRKSFGSRGRYQDDLYDTAEECLSSVGSRTFGVALYDYAGENDGDMPLRAGDRIEIKSTADDSWWEVSDGVMNVSYCVHRCPCPDRVVVVVGVAIVTFLQGKRGDLTGYFPASYVQVISKDETILRCLFDFAGQEKDELSVVANQILVQVRDEGNGWIIGRTGTVEGAIPSSYVEIVTQ